MLLSSHSTPCWVPCLPRHAHGPLCSFSGPVDSWHPGSKVFLQQQLAHVLIANLEYGYGLCYSRCPTLHPATFQRPFITPGSHWPCFGIWRVVSCLPRPSKEFWTAETSDRKNRTSCFKYPSQVTYASISKIMYRLGSPTPHVVPGCRLSRSFLGHGPLCDLRPDRGECGHQLRIGCHAETALPSAAPDIPSGEEDERNLPANGGNTARGGPALSFQRQHHAAGDPRFKCYTSWQPRPRYRTSIRGYEWEQSQPCLGFDDQGRRDQYRRPGIGQSSAKVRWNLLESLLGKKRGSSCALLVSHQLASLERRARCQMEWLTRPLHSLSVFFSLASN